MKNLLFLIALSLILFPSLSQAQKSESNCGYVPDRKYIANLKNPNSMINKRLAFLKDYSIKNDINKIKKIDYRNGNFEIIGQIDFNLEENEDGFFEEKRIIPVVIHIVRRSGDSGGILSGTVRNAIDRVNSVYSVFNMEFKICQTRYISSTAIFNTEFDNTADDDNTSKASYTVLDVENRNVPGKLNMYFVPNSNTSWAWRPLENAKKQHILFLNAQVSNESTVSHEIGHWFGLNHTHNDGDELVNGSNCSSAGDFICDTAADPNLSGHVNAACDYAPGIRLRDANNQTYAPDPRNMMCYAPKECRNRFSDGQILFMQSALVGMETDRGYTFDACNNGYKSWRYSAKALAKWDVLNKSLVDFSNLRFGDFNGDGKTDVFTSSNGQWKVSYGGTSRWTNLQKSSIALKDLGFGDFNGDGKTDVFSTWKGQWRYSSAGKSGWKNLTKSNATRANLRFGDFDGDNKTDVFTSYKGQWKYSSAGIAGWKNLTKSNVSIANLRFGDFNGDGKTDVFTSSKGQWKYSSAGISRWKNLTKSNASIDNLGFGDFNGDGKTDVFTSSNGQWKYSSAGTARWKNLTKSGQDMKTLRFGDFDGDRSTDVFTSY